MGNIFVTPAWFFGYDIALEVLFAVIALLVCYYSWKIYKITTENHLRLFSWAFLFIGLSYIVQSFLNLMVLAKLDDDLTNVINLQSVYLLSLFGVYLHSILFLMGLLILTYVSLKIDSLRTFALLVLIIFSSLYFSPSKTFSLYMLSSMLLIFISYYYLTTFWNNRKTTTFMVLMAMILLFIGNVSFIFATDKALYYVIGHVLELIAYILVLVNLLLVLRFGKQKHKNGKKAR